MNNKTMLVCGLTQEQFNTLFNEVKSVLPESYTESDLHETTNNVIDKLRLQWQKLEAAYKEVVLDLSKHKVFKADQIDGRVLFKFESESNPLEENKIKVLLDKAIPQQWENYKLCLW